MDAGDPAAELGWLLDRSPIPAVVFEADGLRIAHANAAARALLGPILDRPDASLADVGRGGPVSHSEAQLRPLREGLVASVVVETRRHLPDGNTAPMEVRLSYSSEPRPLFLALLLDISGRSTVDELQARRDRHRDALAEILRAITRIDSREDLYREACRIAVERGGFRMAWIGLVDEASGDIVPVARAGHVAGYLEEIKLSVRDIPIGRGLAGTALRTGKPVVVSDARVDPLFRPWQKEALARGYESAVALPLCVEGRVIGGLMVYASIANAFGAIEVELLEHLAEDISFKVEVIGREESRRAAEAERDRLAEVVEQATESVVICDLDGRIVYVNPAFTQISGYRQDEVLGRRPDFLQGEGQAPETAAAIGKAILEGGSWAGQSVDRRKDGTERQMDLIIAPRLGHDGRLAGTMTIGRDASRERALEAQLMQAQKLEALGRFAGGIAHDFNNLLTAIAGYAEILKAELAVDDPRTDDVVEIQHAASRATQLTAQLLAFSRRQILNPRPLDPATVVTGVVPMLRRLIGEDIELVVEAEPGLGPVLADPGQLDQVLVNLALNARDAMPRGGRLVIAIAEADIDAEFAAARGSSSPGPHVVFEVSDTGSGMTPEVLNRAFDPFFTTKGPGKGTGLGLSTVFGIVEQSNGCVDVQSEPGQGTTFRIYLPKTLRVSAEASARPDGAAPRGSGTLLVVEDEEPVRSFLCRILEQAGYDVLQAANGEQALEIEAHFDGRIDLLFTDVVMPGMSGRELAETLLRRRPRTPVLYASGYNEEMIADRGVLEKGVSYLPKPYTGADLLQRLRDLLAADAAGIETE
jgi:PAS domain S-box-containing protein